MSSGNPEPGAGDEVVETEVDDQLGPLPLPGAVASVRRSSSQEDDGTDYAGVGASTDSLGSVTADGRQRFSVDTRSMKQVASFGPEMRAAAAATSAAATSASGGARAGTTANGGSPPGADRPSRLAGSRTHSHSHDAAHRAAAANEHVVGDLTPVATGGVAAEARHGGHFSSHGSSRGSALSGGRKYHTESTPLTLSEAAKAEESAERAPPMSMVPGSQVPKPLAPRRGETVGRLTALDQFRQTAAAVKIREVMSSPVYIVLVMLTSVWAIVSHDVRVLWASPDADEGFLVVTWILMGLFLAEVTAYSVLVRGYFLSFFFWLDVLATVSLLPDVLAASSAPEATVRDSGDDVSESVLEDGLRDNLRMSRAARAARTLRVIRMMRASRIGLVGASLGQALSSWWEGHRRTHASITGRTLVYHTHVMIILGIVVLLLGTSTIGHVADDDRTAREGLCMLHVAAPAMMALGSAGAGNWTHLVNTYVNNVQAGADGVPALDVLHLSVRGELVVDWSASGGVAESGLRLAGPAEVLAVSCDDSTTTSASPLPAFMTLAEGSTGLEGDGPDVSRVVLSVRGPVEAQAAADLAAGFFVLAVLTVWLLSFSLEFYRLVLIPLERMMSLLQQMMRDPLAAVDVSRGMKDIARVESYEMQVVEASLIKFGKLLQLGFGDAGARIIARSLNQGELDVMAPGNKVVAVLMFCDIRSFTDVTEILRADVLNFTNSIGAEISECVHSSHGCVNKNIGGE